MSDTCSSSPSKQESDSLESFVFGWIFELLASSDLSEYDSLTGHGKPATLSRKSSKGAKGRPKTKRGN